jgi:uncharacterized damage-inducible protein DinB
MHAGDRIGDAMTQVRPWFERQFSMQLQPEMFPGLIERLRGTPARLEERLGTLPASVLTRRTGDSWSIQEHAGHLLDLEPLMMKRLEEYLHGARILSPADLQNTKTHQAHHNEKPLASILGAFRREREAIIRRLEQLDEPDLVHTALHPRLMQSMTLVDFCHFVAEHDDHHLARISDLLRIPA